MCVNKLWLVCIIRYSYINLRLRGNFVKLRRFSIAKLHSYGEAINLSGSMDPISTIGDTDEQAKFLVHKV